MKIDRLPEASKDGVTRRSARIVVGIALAYAATSMVDDLAARSDALVIWLSGGIVLAGLMMSPLRDWIMLTALVFGIDVILTSSTGSSLTASLVSSVLSVAQPLAVGGLLRFFLPTPFLRASAKGLAVFAAAAVAVPVFVTMVSWTPAYLGDQVTLANLAAAKTLGLLVVPPIVLGLAVARPQFESWAAGLAVGIGLAALGAVAGSIPAGWTDGFGLLLAILPLPVIAVLAGATSMAAGSAAVLVLALIAGIAGPPDVLAGIAGQDAGLVILLAAAQVVVLATGYHVARREQLTAELAKARQDAQAAHHAKLDFLGVMGHELRTPIAAVLGMTDLLAESPLPPREKDYLDTIRTSGQHLLAVINDVLDYARGETGRLKLAPVSFSIVELIEQIRAFVAPQAAERALELRFELDGSLPAVVSGDPRRLRQILLNLISNALKFTHRGSVDVTVRHVLVEPGINRVRFEVQDTGIGMTREKAEAAFEAFDVSDSSISRRYGGIGLGLAISKRLVEAMGGTMGVESQPGVGSLFWFEVTLETAEPSRQVKLDLADMPPQKVLVVDDGAVNRRVILQMLRRHGHEVTSARDGLEAVELVVRGRFDLILMDVQMPVMDGLEATRLIRELKSPQSRTPIVALTASIMPDEYQRCIDAGMDQVLVKPIEWPQLFAVMMSYQSNRPVSTTTDESIQ